MGQKMLGARITTYCFAARASLMTLLAAMSFHFRFLASLYLIFTYYCRDAFAVHVYLMGFSSRLLMIFARCAAMPYSTCSSFHIDDALHFAAYD